MFWSLPHLSLLVIVYHLMDGSRVTQSLDYLWFYDNIFTCTHDQVASLTDQFTTLIHTREPSKRDSSKPNAPSILNQQNETENVETMIPPRCAKYGEISSEFEAARVISNNSEILLKSGRETKKRSETRKRRSGNRSGLNRMKVILGVFDVNEVRFVRFKEPGGYQMFAIQPQTMKMPPFDDDVAMKEHLKSWAYAVACTVK